MKLASVELSLEQLVLFSLATSHKTILGQAKRLLMKPDYLNSNHRVDPKIIRMLQLSYWQLYRAELNDIETGILPGKFQGFDRLFFLLKHYPAMLLDLPKSWKREKKRRFFEVPQPRSADEFPRYYRRNFHNQTDGYFTKNSAKLYDTQVEIVFNGAADLMRRRVITPLKAWNSQSRPSSNSLEILDCATGNGRFMHLLREVFPNCRLHGLDLSPQYLAYAQQIWPQKLSPVTSWTTAKAELMPYKSDSFDLISCIFLFHELPRSIRILVMKELSRVIKPGGRLVVCDSIQKNDHADFQPLLDLFPMAYHEPYYRDYTADDLDCKWQQQGFRLTQSFCFHLSKYWVLDRLPG